MLSGVDELERVQSSIDESSSEADSSDEPDAGAESGSESEFDVDPYPVHRAARVNEVDLARDFIASGFYADDFDDLGSTPLHTAAGLGHADMVNFLLDEQEIDADIKNQFDETSLYLALSSGHFNVVRILINAEADVNAALFYSIRLNNANAIQTLLAVGADITVRNPQGQTPLDLALELKFERISNLLLNHESSKSDHDELSKTSKNPENSVVVQSQQEQVLLNALLEKTDLGIQDTLDIFDEISKTLARLYHEKPAVDALGKDLPLEFESTLESQQPYYYHSIHTAWRYVQEFNPWIDPKHEFSVKVSDGQYAAYITLRDKKLIASLWLSSKEEKCLDLFISTLSDLCRSHNHDSFDKNVNDRNPEKNQLESKKGTKLTDDGLADKPTCLIGVKSRLTQFLRLLPSMLEKKYLTPQDFKCFFEESMIAQNLQYPNNFYGMVEKLSCVDLRILEQKINDSVVELKPIDEPQMKYLRLSETVVAHFIESCSDHYSEAVWQANKNNIIKLNGLEYYEGYQDYAQVLAANLTSSCFGRVTTLLKTLIHSKEQEEGLDVASQSVAPMLFQEIAKQQDNTKPKVSRKHSTANKK